ncbi:MAG: hypothetical protein MK095_06025 [Phycisphaerales bacterium]|nr:hypothetical protein [Phycisphaerales bacterium]
MDEIIGGAIGEGFERLINTALMIAGVLLAVVLVVLLVRYCWKRKRMKLKQQDASGKLKS